MSLPLYPASNEHTSRIPDIPSLAEVKAIIGIAAGKGGVGKSAITVTLALALQQAGYRVGVMDTDLYGPSIRQMLPEKQPPVQRGTLIEPAKCSGEIAMISMAHFGRTEGLAAIRAPLANQWISQFIHRIAWGALDFLLIDFPPGTGDIQLTLSQQAPLLGALMVTTPQEVALLDVRKAMALFEKVSIPIVGIIENMSYYQMGNADPVFPFGKGGGERLAHETAIPFLGGIPLDPVLCRCGDQGQSLFEADPHSHLPITQAFQSLARAVVAQVNCLQECRKRALLSFELRWVPSSP